MTQEEKDLLLKDLCARLPYGVICNTPKGDGHLCSINKTIFGNKYGINIKATERDYFNDREEVIKPYLRPISSMTEEEKKEFCKIEGRIAQYFPCKYIKLIFSVDELDWLNKKMFDYRKDDEDKTMIKKGIALKAPEGMYEFE